MTKELKNGHEVQNLVHQVFTVVRSLTSVARKSFSII